MEIRFIWEMKHADVEAITRILVMGLCLAFSLLKRDTHTSSAMTVCP
jgi:hypothetical protein